MPGTKEEHVVGTIAQEIDAFAINIPFYAIPRIADLDIRNIHALHILAYYGMP